MPAAGRKFSEKNPWQHREEHGRYKIYYTNSPGEKQPLIEKKGKVGESVGLSRGEKYICLLALCFLLATAGISLLRWRDGPGRPAEAAPLPSAAPEAASAWEDGLLRLNAATAEDLDALPGIGPVLAERILALREERGGFSALSELLDVEGIGAATLEEISPYLIVEDDYADIGSG